MSIDKSAGWMMRSYCPMSELVYLKKEFQRKGGYEVDEYVRETVMVQGRRYR
jgi:hypothetical protein